MKDFVIQHNFFLHPRYLSFPCFFNQDYKPKPSGKIRMLLTFITRVIILRCLKKNASSPLLSLGIKKTFTVGGISTWNIYFGGKHRGSSSLSQITQEIVKIIPSLDQRQVAKIKNCGAGFF